MLSKLRTKLRSACLFGNHPQRCLHAVPQCRIEQAQLREIAPLHFSTCDLNDGAGP